MVVFGRKCFIFTKIFALVVRKMKCVIKILVEKKKLKKKKIQIRKKKK